MPPQTTECRAGIRTIADDLKVEAPAHDADHASWVVVGMALSAEAYLEEHPSAGVRELADTLAEGWHSVDDSYSRARQSSSFSPPVPTFLWGPAAQRTADEQRKFPVNSNLSTERVALAVATCATRGCGLFDRCMAIAESKGWIHHAESSERLSTAQSEPAQ